MRIVLLFIAFACFTFTAAAQTDPVRETLNKYDRAWNAKETKAIADMLDENYVYFSSVGTLTDKKSTLEFLAKPDYKLTFVDRSEIRVHISDGNTAIVSSRWKGKGSWSGGEINDDQRCGQVFVKRGKAWKLVSEHCVQIPQQ
jgi:ketosteroid isomerase-like protein